MTHEIMMKRNDNEEKIDKSLLYKVSSSSSKDVENDDLVILTRKFKRFIKGKKVKERRNLRNKKSKFEVDKYRSEVNTLDVKSLGMSNPNVHHSRRVRRNSRKRPLQLRVMNINSH